MRDVLSVMACLPRRNRNCANEWRYHQGAAADAVLAGLVERVTFHNSENGFCVLRALDVPSRLEAMPATQLAAYGRAASAPAGMLPWREQVLRTQPTALAPLQAGSRRRLTVCVRGRAALPSSSAVPNSSERSLGGPVAVSSGCGNRRLRDHGRPADAGGAPGRDTRTRGKRRDPAVPSVESEPPASAVLAPVSFHGPFSNIIPGYSKNQKAAKDFLRWFRSKEIYDEWFISQQGFSVGPTKVWQDHNMWQIDPVMLPYRTAAQSGRFAGYAGPAGRAAAETISKYIIVDMYAKAVQGIKAADAVSWATGELQKIYGA